jgi:hypothetical protein
MPRLRRLTGAPTAIAIAAMVAVGATAGGATIAGVKDRASTSSSAADVSIIVVTAATTTSSMVENERNRQRNPRPVSFYCMI